MDITATSLDDVADVSRQHKLPMKNIYSSFILLWWRVLEYDTNALFRNVWHESPSDAAPHPGRLETSNAPMRRPKNSHML